MGKITDMLQGSAEVREQDVNSGYGTDYSQKDYDDGDTSEDKHMRGCQRK